MNFFLQIAVYIGGFRGIDHLGFVLDDGNVIRLAFDYPHYPVSLVDGSHNPANLV